MDSLYLAVAKRKHDALEEKGTSTGNDQGLTSTFLQVVAPIETFITSFVLCYCKHRNVNVLFVETELREDEKLYVLPEKLCQELNSEIQEELQTLPKHVQSCKFPVLSSADSVTFTAGLCSVLRWIIKIQIKMDSNNFAKKLLGFRAGCLMACSEVSAWTRFCENDMLGEVRNPTLIDFEDEIHLPKNLVRFEKLLGLPVRTHNILKRKQDIRKADNIDETQLLFGQLNLNTLEENSETTEAKLKHIYAEGIDQSLADFILLPCVHFLLVTLQNKCSSILEYFPLVYDWYRLMMGEVRVKQAAQLCGLEQFNKNESNKSSKLLKVIVPDVPKDTLYMRNPKRSRVKARGQNPKPVIEKLNDHEIEPLYSSCPSSMMNGLDWHNLPLTAHPAGGDLPLSRVDRKCHQVESLVTTVLDLALPNDVIVDFCSGTCWNFVGLLFTKMRSSHD